MIDLMGCRSSVLKFYEHLIIIQNFISEIWGAIAVEKMIAAVKVVSNKTFDEAQLPYKNTSLAQFMQLCRGANVA